MDILKNEEASDAFSSSENLPQELLKTIEFLTQVCSKLGYDISESEVKKESEGFHVNLVYEGNASLLIGKKGKSLDSLQFLVSAFCGQLEFSDKVFLDINGYREKQLSFLKKEVLFVMENVRKNQKSYLMNGSYTPIERKHIHLIVQESGDLKTESEGEGFLKSVWIIYL